MSPLARAVEPEHTASRWRTITPPAPSRARWYAVLTPMVPAPTLTTSAVSVMAGAGVRGLVGDCLGGERSIRIFSVGFGTIFARDNALAARDRRGRPVLLVPRALRTSGESSASPLDARAAQRLLAVRVVRSRLFWHGGNILFDGECLAVGADTISENVTRLGLTATE